MTAPLQISVGEQMHKWTVIEVLERRATDGHQLIVCQCQCGTTREMQARKFRKGRNKGCLKCKNPSRTRHGHMHVGKESLTHYSWRAMRDRCENPKSPSWKWYGAKGITVCERWYSFDNFLTDMGERPGKDYTIERKVNDLGYSPDNCCWLPAVEQNRHSSGNRLLTFQNQTLPMVVWSERTGIDQHRIRHRLNAGWSVEEALTIPIRPHKPYQHRSLPLSLED